MKLIDIFNKIANGEEVRFKIIDNDEIRDDIFEVENGSLRNSTCGKWLETKVSHDTWESISSYFLNEEVEIIEEEKKIPEKIDVWYDPIKDTKLERHDTDTSIEILAAMCDNLKDKYNEIIDYLKSKGE